METILLGLIVLAIPLSGVAGFFMALKLRGRADAIEARLLVLEARLAAGGPLPADAGEGATAGPAAQEQRGEDAARTETADAPPMQQAPEADGPADGAIDAAPPQEPVPVTPPRSLEERLGARWTVWVGGVALALGGLFLVRYSIEQGLLGPTARIVMGLVFAAALIAAGEFLRRRDGGISWPGLPEAHVPGVLTAAGASTAFGALYAAHALYGLIGPGTTFAALALVSLATLAAAALHGPALAALGLVAALAHPLLIASDDPQLWPVVLYLLFPVGAAYALARVRLWRWLAGAAALGALAWSVLIVAGASAAAPALTHILLQTALAGGALLLAAHAGTADEDASPDLFASLVLAGFAAATILALATVEAGASRVPAAGMAVVLFTALAVLRPAGAAAALMAGAVAAGTLAFWPIAREVAAEPATVLPGPAGDPPRPEALTLFLAFAALAALGVAGASLARVARGRLLPPSSAALLVAAATLGPLAVLTVAWWRVAGFDRSVPFAVAAGLLAALFVAAAAQARRLETERFDGVTVALGGLASAAVAALALGLTFALDKGMLTVAFALSALGTAYVAERTGIAALRYVVGGLGVLVLGRLVWDPAVAGAEVGSTPIFNWLLWGYGVPALCFGVASRLLARQGHDRVVRLTESLTLIFAYFLVIFQIRHALYAGDPLAVRSGLLEAGLTAAASFAFAAAVLTIEAGRPDIVTRVASLVFGVIGAGLAVFGLAVAANPLFTGDAVHGGALVNALLPAYLLPALAAAFLARRSVGLRPLWYQRAALGLAFTLFFLFVVLAIRRFFQGPLIGLWRNTGEAELYTYSAVFLVIGIALLGAGLIRDSRLLRQASSLFIVLTVVKVFLVDMANLEGVMRALSFIGLGLALVGVGFVYQRLLHRTAPPGGS